MKATLKRLISSSTTTIVLLLVYGAGLAIATFIEEGKTKENSTPPIGLLHSPDTSQ